MKYVVRRYSQGEPKMLYEGRNWDKACEFFYNEQGSASLEYVQNPVTSWLSIKLRHLVKRLGAERLLCALGVVKIISLLLIQWILLFFNPIPEAIRTAAIAMLVYCIWDPERWVRRLS